MSIKIYTQYAVHGDTPDVCLEHDGSSELCAGGKISCGIKQNIVANLKFLRLIGHGGASAEYRCRGCKRKFISDANNHWSAS